MRKEFPLPIGPAPTEGLRPTGGEREKKETPLSSPQGGEDKGEGEKKVGESSELGVDILRFNDLELLNNIEGVYQVIVKTIENKKKPPHPYPLPRGEREKKKTPLPSSQWACAHRRASAHRWGEGEE